jgi:ribonucleoside-triphosphate reductase
MRAKEIEREIVELKAKLDGVKGSPTEVYARIVGYYRSVRNWNKGKRQEFGERANFVLPPDMACPSPTLPAGEASFITADTGNSSLGFAPTGAPKGIREYILFTRKSCPNCPPVKEAVGKLGIPGSIVDVDSDGGFSLASERKVFAAPTVILVGEDGAEYARAYNPKELEAVLSAAAIP